MKSNKDCEKFRPFENLDALIKKNQIQNKLIKTKLRQQKTIPRQKKVPKNTKPVEITQTNPQEESRLFINTMAAENVIPIKRGDKINSPFKRELPTINLFDETEEQELKELKNLIQYGQGFVISNTPEYIEGTGYQIHPSITKRLHRGDFSIENYIDLHGLYVENAQYEVDNFLEEAIKTGKRTVLIIHGRGLSSPSGPVLKRKVLEWLTRGPWRKWVMAYTSARACDGGAGATYVLLRKRPVTKRFKKKPRSDKENTGRKEWQE